jgi:hypothetical protein
MDCRSIIIAKLAKLGADGLCNPEAECGCSLHDLAPCAACFLDCKPARLSVAKRAGDGYEKGDRIYTVLPGA